LLRQLGFSVARILPGRALEASRTTNVIEKLVRNGAYFDHGLIPLVLYFGDFDLNGSDMTRDLQMRLRRYTGEPVEVRRLGLTME
jgi:hypothetical protein